MTWSRGPRWGNIGWVGRDRERGREKEREKIAGEIRKSKSRKHPVLGTRSTYWRSIVKLHEATVEGSTTHPPPTAPEPKFLCIGGVHSTPVLRGGSGASLMESRLKLQ